MRSLTLWPAWPAILLLLVFAGCQQPPPQKSVPAPVAPPKPAPAALAERIETEIREAWTRDEDPAIFMVPDDDTFARMRDLVEKLCQALRQEDAVKAAEPLKPAAAALGFVLERMESEGRAAWVLKEGAERRGRGIYVFLEHPAEQAIVLQAPHQRNDLYTERLAARGFARGYASAVFGSTINRNHCPAEEKGGIPCSDVANAPRSFFQAATEGAARAFKQSAFVQLHGFESMRDEDRGEYQVILSTGDERWTGALNSMVVQLREALGDKAVGRYGLDVQVLGATRNAQGRYLREHADDTFVHIEMTLNLRKALLEDNAQFERMLRAVAGIPQPEPAAAQP
ncbi:MAG: hypothetical protein HS116_20245 [Planctomycetes bacterium]|nr:hypothetical protein [Planctomycetota bacterium]